MIRELEELQRPSIKTTITVYEVNNGWRYRVLSRDDGNYMTAREALWSAENWLSIHHGSNVETECAEVL